MGLRQFSAGGENHGRAAALKAIAYTTGDELKDDRNNRRYNYAANRDPERVLASALFLPPGAPEYFQRGNFASLVEQQQTVWSSLATFEEKQRFQHAGRNGKQGKPIISRSDVVILDKRLFLMPDGTPRPDGLKYAQQIITDFVREEFTRKGLVASFSIHDQDMKGETGNGNFHAHIISNYRKLTAEGWGERVRPYGKDAWKVWAGAKFKKVSALQQRKLEALGAVPKPDSKTRRAETLKAWNTAGSVCRARSVANQNRNPVVVASRSVPDGTRTSVALPPVQQGTASGRYAVLGKAAQVAADNDKAEVGSPAVDDGFGDIDPMAIAHAATAYDSIMQEASSRVAALRADRSIPLREMFGREQAILSEAKIRAAAAKQRIMMDAKASAKKRRDSRRPRFRQFTPT